MKTRFSDYIANTVTEIPTIQRDYVQGADRNRDKRDPFLRQILTALLPESTREFPLDFIYGSSRSDTGEFHPIDGQQRLTTLTFLGWLLVRRGLPEDEAAAIDFQKLAYRTRTTSDVFCQEMLKYSLPRGVKGIKRHITTVPLWFAWQWLNDPTVVSVLELLDAADAILDEPEFKPHVEAMARRFFSDLSPIVFETLDMEDYGLTEDLYIKMNSRGKALTEFEILKADLIHLFDTKFPKKIYPYGKVAGREVTVPEYFKHAIEHQWTDMFWSYAFREWNNLTDKKNSPYPVTDDYFMRFFIHFTELIFAGSHDMGALATNLQLDKSEVFRGKDGLLLGQHITDIYSDADNVVALFRTLDLIHSLSESQGGINGFFQNLFTSEFEPGGERINVFSPKVNLFEAVISPEGLDLPHRFLLHGLLRAMLDYDTCVPTPELRDFLRILWGWLLSRNQRRGGKLLSVRFDLSIEHTMLLRKITDDLLALASPWDALRASAMTELKDEKTKLAYRDGGKYEAIRVLSNHPWIKGEMMNIYPSLDELTAREMIERFLSFAALTDDERFCMLLMHGADGAHPWKNYDFFGKENKDRSVTHWDYIFATATAESPRTCGAITGIFLQKPIQDFTPAQAQYYALKYPEFRKASPVHYFYSKGEFQLWALQDIRPRPMSGYTICPYAYVVRELLSDMACDTLGPNVWNLEEPHDRLWIDRFRFSMECVDAGWIIHTDGGDFLPGIHQERFVMSGEEISDSENCLRFVGNVLQDMPGKDRVETALVFLEAVASEIMKARRQVAANESVEEKE